MSSDNNMQQYSTMKLKTEYNAWKIPKSLHNLLKDYDGKVITRFPPEPSGILHIGHIKAIFINYVIAKKYNGKMILRFDNTNPVTESLDYEIAIQEDITKLGIIPDTVTYSSDYFQKLINYAEKLVYDGKAYVDTTQKDIMKEQRRNCISSANRDNSIQHNVELWDQMKQGLLPNSCLRLKMNMSHSNANCRDPTIFRYVDQPHHRTGEQFKVYPSYDFACPIIDSLEGITHAFRSVEYQDREEQYSFILDILNLRKPIVLCYGKVKFKDIVLSKRKIKALIQKGVISNWDDPRLFTLRGLFNRGLHLDALKQFVATLGFSNKTPPIMSTEKLLTINRKLIDKIATRYMCLSNDNLQQYKILGDLPIDNHIDKFTKNKDLGTRKIDYSHNILINEIFQPNEEITLMFMGNAIVSENNNLQLNLDGDYKNTKHKVIWIPKENPVKVKILKYNGYEPPIITSYLGESQLINVKKGEYIQLLKMNYYMCVDVSDICITLVELD